MRRRRYSIIREAATSSYWRDVLFAAVAMSLFFVLGWLFDAFVEGCGYEIMDGRFVWMMLGLAVGIGVMQVEAMEAIRRALEEEKTVSRFNATEEEKDR